jgi:outer membrane protein assembly factor BamB
MEDGLSRRRLLTTAGTAVALSTAGCSQLPGGVGQNSGVSRTIGERDDDQPDEWPTLGQNPQSTKFNPGGAGPKDEPSVDWTYDSENILAPPAMAGSSIGLSGVEHLTALTLGGSRRWSITYTGLLDETQPNTFPVVLTEDVVCSSIRRDDEPAKLVAYTHDGELLWTVDLGEIYGSGTPFVTQDSGIVYVSLPVNFTEFGGAGIIAVDINGGEILWSENLDPLLPVAPVITEQFILSPTGNEQMLALNKQTGEVEWEFELLDRDIVRPVVSDGTIYVQYGNDTVGLSVDDGSTSFEATDSFGGRFAFVDDVIIEPAGDTLRAYDLQRDELLWEQEYSASLNPPAVADGVAYVGGEDKRIRGVEIASGDELWSQQLEDDVMRPVVAQDRVLAVSGDTLYSLS